MAEENLEGLERVGRLLVQERQDDPAFVKAGNQLVEIVAELLAAREVVRATRGHECSTRWHEPCGHQQRALAGYDQVTATK